MVYSMAKAYHEEQERSKAKQRHSQDMKGPSAMSNTPF
jgi:hypothetical protein